jgi:hypothetical protein
VNVWLALDPETGRITAQDRPIERTELPPGLRGEGWPRRTVDVPQQTWTKTLKATYSPDSQDRLHRGWWEAGTDA